MICDSTDALAVNGAGESDGRPSRLHEQMLFRADRCYLTADASPLTRPSTAWRLPRPFTANESSPCNDRHANDQDRRNRRRHEQMLFYSPAPFTADRRYLTALAGADTADAWRTRRTH